MITGELKSKIDHIWDTMWSGRRRPGHGTRRRSWIVTGRSTRAATLPATSNGSTKPSVTAQTFNRHFLAQPLWLA